MSMILEINGNLITAVIGLLGTLSGAFIGGVLVYYTSVKTVTVQSRVRYVLRIVEMYPSGFASFYEALRNGDANRLKELMKSRFYYLLVMVLPRKIKRQLEDSIANKEWDKAEDLLTNIASGKWD
jgi:hypothetical protein